MNIKKISIIISLLYINQKVFSIPVIKESATTSLDSDSEDIIDSLVEDIAGEEVAVFDIPSEDENVTVGIENSGSIKECSTKECHEASKNILSIMDTSTNPCEDFYQFTCGNWANNNSKKYFYDRMNEQQDLINSEIIELLKGDYIINEGLSKEGQEYDKMTFNKLKNIFNKCMNMYQFVVEDYGNEYLYEFLNKLNIYEKVEGDNDTDKFTNLLVKIQNKGINIPFFRMSITEDDRDYDKKFIYIASSDILSESYTLGKTKEKPEIELLFKEYIKIVLSAFNQNEENIEEKIDIIYDIEQKISDMETLYSNKNQYENEIEEYNLDTLNTMYPFINWKLYLKRMTEFYEIKSVDFNNINTIVYDSKLLKAINNVLYNLNIKKLTVYLEWRTILSLKKYSEYIRNAENDMYNKIVVSFPTDIDIENPSEIRNYYNNDDIYDNYEYPSNYYDNHEYPSNYYDNNEYPSNYYDNNEYPSNYFDNQEYPSNYYDNNDYNDNEENQNIDNSNRCITVVNDFMPLALAKYYIDRKLPNNIYNEINQMIKYIKESMFERISNIDWLDEDTKKNMIEKILKMKEVIGFPEEFNDPKILYEKYQYIDVIDLFYYHKFYEISETRKQIKKLGTAELQDAMLANAFYLQRINTINVPYGILHYPYYDSNQQDYINYGYMGSTLGHELTHAFDSNGRHYDAVGNKIDWWTDNDDKDFKELSQCFIDQYNAFSIMIDNEKRYVDGELTLAENIADNGGLDRGYEAWQKSMKNPEAAERNQKLPGLSNFTLDQLFYIAYGQSFCDNNFSSILNDNHSPGKARVNAVVSNSKNFSKAFNCPLGSPMNPEKKCLLW